MKFIISIKWNLLKSSIVFVLWSCLQLAIVHNAYGQDTRPSTNSPYNTVYTHLYFLQTDSYEPEKAAITLDPEANLDSLKRIRRSIQLKQILDGSGLFVNLEQLPKANDYVDSVSEKAEFTLFPKNKPEIYLVRKNSNWYYSKQTVELIPKMHRELFPFGSTFLINLFPAFGQKAIFGLAIWQYIGMIILIILCVLFYWLTHRILRPFIRRLLRRFLSDRGDIKQVKHLDKITSAFSLLVILLVLTWLLPSLLLPIEFGSIVRKIISVLQIIVIALTLVRVANFFIYHLEKAAERTASRMDDQLLPLLNKIVQVVIFTGALLHVLSTLDVNVTALIAGVSIGGLAIALAAQDAVKNLIGSVMIFADRPFQVGDYVVGSGFEGEIAEVGFRTTRIKAIDTSIIAVPNGAIANMNIENKGVRIMRLFNIVIGVTYSSKANDLKAFIADLKQLIIDHPSLSNESYYVHLKEMADSSINIMFRTYLNIPTYAEELALKEELLFKIMELAEKNNLEFAFPSRSVYIESQNGKTL